MHLSLFSDQIRLRDNAMSDKKGSSRLHASRNLTANFHDIFQLVLFHFTCTHSMLHDLLLELEFKAITLRSV